MFGIGGDGGIEHVKPIKYRRQRLSLVRVLAVFVKLKE
jgi:hypothetical protein